ncbi:PA domain-containing protein [Stenotrophomonas sp. YIM B06876]|uniref:PA domain-containing protein n=1 Tax=Stenotrophomonas sp. YIM B06876 TaxID=3060211 RepID=UPI00273A119B|nr:PA domain-containing protein [Stenotrophomonas sp. YIM B06876]
MKRQMMAALVAAALFGGSGAQAGVITPVNLDPAGQGLNDTTPRAAEGGNPGSTVGEQRRIVYQFAADLWGSLLQNTPEIRVGASFQPLACTDTGGTLGSAGAYWIAADFPGAPLPGAVYHGALAKAISGQELESYPVDITSRFNANLGSPGCLTSSGWYYGLDGNTPAGKISFLDVVMHEIAHGLGFSGFVGYSSGVLGERAGAVGYSDPYTHNAFDNIRNLRFTAAGMTNSDRAAAIRTRGRPGWDGANVKAQVPMWLEGATVLQVSGGTLNLVSQFYGVASFGPPATASNFNAPVKLVNDGVGDPTDACEPLAAGSLTGKIAIISRGSCSFEPKTVNAQNAGAVGVIIANVATSADPGTAPGMADDATVVATIPALSVNLSDGNAIKAAAQGASVVTASLGKVAGQYAGADPAGRALLYAPAVVASGSSFSHFETVLTPNALMEPSINDSLSSSYLVDLTLALFADEGWRLNTGTAKVNGCDTGVKLFMNPGVIAGANLVANERVCRVEAAGNRIHYLGCMDGLARDLQALGMIGTADKAKVRLCATKAAL